MQGFLHAYASTGAFTGHTPAQAPQEIHSSSLITYFESPAAIHETGHSLSQAPQLIHSSLIEYAKSFTPLKNCDFYTKSVYTIEIFSARFMLMRKYSAGILSRQYVSAKRKTGSLWSWERVVRPVYPF